MRPLVEPDYLLGNINEEHMSELIGSDEQYKFGQDKYDSLPIYCLECPVLLACSGECPKNRFNETPEREAGLNYLCVGYKAFFQRVDEPMKIMATAQEINRQVINVGSGQETSVRELSRMVLEETSSNAEVIYNTRTDPGVSRMCADLSLAREQLGCRSGVSLKEGVRLTLDRDARFRNEATCLIIR